MENTNDKGRNDKKAWQRPECVELDVQKTELEEGQSPDGSAMGGS